MGFIFYCHHIYEFQILMTFYAAQQDTLHNVTYAMSHIHVYTKLQALI
jgi:hypothetical protein